MSEEFVATLATALCLSRLPGASQSPAVIGKSSAEKRLRITETEMRIRPIRYQSDICVTVRVFKFVMRFTFPKGFDASDAVSESYVT